jgi:pSer/pThr/pTyr-binding forkhead associated (FHA) protein
MSVQLVPIHAGSAPSVLISRPVILIGRHPECDVRIDSPQISRRHCCLALAYDRLTIRDLGSRNGVRVNGQVVDEARLQPGDEVAISQFLYRLDRLETVEPQSRNPRANPITPSASPLPPLIDLDEDFIPLDD